MPQEREVRLLSDRKNDPFGGYVVNPTASPNEAESASLLVEILEGDAKIGHVAILKAGHGMVR